MTWSKPSYTLVLGWWIVATIARSSCAASSVMNDMIAAAAAASSPDVGSSRKMSLGSLMSAAAIESRRFCPPDMPCTNSLPTIVSAHESRPILVRICATSSSRDAAVPPRKSSAVYIIVWRHVRNGQCWSCCGTTKQRELKSDGDIGAPSSVTEPVVVPPKPCSVSALMSVVLPAPLGPMIASTRPEHTVAEISSRIFFVPVSAFLSFTRNEIFEN